MQKQLPRLKLQPVEIKISPMGCSTTNIIQENLSRDRDLQTRLPDRSTQTAHSVENSRPRMNVLQPFK